MSASASPTRASRRLPSLTVRGWAFLLVALVLIVVAYATGWREVLYVGLTLLALVALSMVMVGSRATRLTVSRRIGPDVVSAGESAGVMITAQNGVWLPSASARWRDTVPAELGAQPMRDLRSLAPRGRSGSKVTLRYTVDAVRRGSFEIGPFAVLSTDSFGICRHEQVTGGTDPIIVLPRIAPLEGGAAAPASVSDAAIRAAMAGRGQDDVIAREYRSGDALRHVHWRASAHRGELMVRQEQRHDDSHAIVIIDNRLEHWRSTAAFEWAVSFAASVVVHLSLEGNGVLVVPTVGDAAHDEVPTAEESLMSLATITRLPAEQGGAYLKRLDDIQDRGPAPIFAVMGSMADAEWRELATRRTPRSSAAAVIVGADAEPDLLWSAGWRCTLVDDPRVEMSAVWRSISAGVTRG